MRFTVSKPLAALAVPVIAGAVALSACGGSDDGATLPTLDRSTESTAFIVRAAPTTTTTLPTVADAETPTRTGPQEYVVQFGDYPLKVASEFDVTLEALVAANGWGSAEEFPAPETVIQVPSPEAADDEGQVAAEDGDEAPDTAATSGDECSVRAYTIEASDTSRLAVANKFDIAIDALDAANAATNGYDAFYPGLQIVIPAQSDC